MGKGKQSPWQQKGDDKPRSHKGRRDWTPEQVQAHQKDRKKRFDKRAQRRKGVQ